MSQKVARMVTMLELIPAQPRKISVLALKDHLEALGYSVTERTVQRDLHALSQHFTLNLDDRNKPFGWSRSRHTAAGIPSINPYEALTFVMAYEQFSRSLPQDLRTYLKPKMLEAKYELNRHKDGDFQHWPDKIAHVGSGFQLLAAKTDSANMDVIYDAVLKEKRLSITHKGQTDTLISPLGVVLRDQVVYLVCTFWEYTDIRQLAVHRIKQPKVLNKGINKPEGFSLSQYCASGAMGYLESDDDIALELIMLKNTADHLYDTAISDDQKIEDVDEQHVKITGTVKDCKDLRWWILGFGGQVEVIRPAALREELKQEAIQMMKNYQG